MKPLASATFLLAFFIPLVLFSQNRNTKEEGRENFLNIEGTVIEAKKNPDGTSIPINSAKMILMDKNYKIILSKYSNKQGKFSLQALPNTQYYVIAEKQGYGSKRISVTTSSHFDTEKEQIEMILLPTGSGSDDRTDYLKKVVNEANDLNTSEPPKGNPASSNTASNNANPANSTGTNTANNVVFKIQFGKFTVPAPVKFFAPVQGVEVYREEGFIVYSVGNYRTMFEANAALQELKAKGYPDAFVTAYLNNAKIPIAQAAALAPKQ